MKFQTQAAVICRDTDGARRMNSSALLAAAAISIFAAAPILAAHAQTTPTTTQTPTMQTPTTQAGAGQTSATQMPATQTSGRDELFDARTAANGACHGMDWHVVVHPDKTMNGVVSWDGSKHMAHLNGTVDPNGNFKANAVESGNSKTDTVSGMVQASDMKASISGTGTPCDNETMNVPRAMNGVSHG